MKRAPWQKSNPCNALSDNNWISTNPTAGKLCSQSAGPFFDPLIAGLIQKSIFLRDKKKQNKMKTDAKRVVPPGAPAPGHGGDPRSRSAHLRPCPPCGRCPFHPGGGRTAGHSLRGGPAMVKGMGLTKYQPMSAIRTGLAFEAFA